MSDSGHEHLDFVPRRFVVAEFATPDGLLDGTTKMREAGYTELDTHTPFPIHGLEEALGLKRPKIPLIVLCGGIAGACIAYSLIYFCNVIDWPLNIGNRPPHGPPANIPITFELAVLLGGGSSFMGFFALVEAAAALSPDLRVGGLQPRVDRRVLPVGRAAARAPTWIARSRTSAPRARCRRRDRRGVRAMTARLRSPLRLAAGGRAARARRLGLHRREHPRPDGRQPAARRTATARATSSPTA